MADKARKHVKVLFLVLIATVALAAAVVATGGSSILLAVLATMVAIELLTIGRIADRGLSLDCTPRSIDAASEVAPLKRAGGLHRAA
ncbi:hypothetical protein [Gordonia phthalatica]|uniref:Uncharacterized protein n=1 Tax=Gordonia phthalatica TaxID=1136941 RepID=A0A0N9NK38_9ACTN|nr:hypothetical protein [Gordonia phthalatica]ALG86370.1 hypothetical protein ACH46_20085 [Gordonia phthalatica]